MKCSLPSGREIGQRGTGVSHGEQFVGGRCSSSNLYTKTSRFDGQNKLMSWKRLEVVPFTGRRQILCRAAYQPFAFSEKEYYRVTPQIIQSRDNSTTGYLLFQRNSGDTFTDDRAMLVAIGGDTLQAIAMQFQGRQEVRPLSIDLLWTVLQRGMAISKREWTVLRVAVVGMTQSAYLGRIFFGNKVTGEVCWDVDSRPSDATWLAIRTGAPIYINKSIWEASATPFDEFLGHSFSKFDTSQQEPVVGLSGADFENETGISRESRKIDVAVAMLTIRQHDPEPLKRLKMELKVALQEEDYGAAARIRDHPFMRLHLASFTAECDGDRLAARKYLQKLYEEIAKFEQISSSEA